MLTNRQTATRAESQVEMVSQNREGVDFPPKSSAGLTQRGFEGTRSSRCFENGAPAIIPAPQSAIPPNRDSPAVPPVRAADHPNEALAATLLGYL